MLCVHIRREVPPFLIKQALECTDSLRRLRLLLSALEASMHHMSQRRYRWHFRAGGVLSYATRCVRAFSVDSLTGCVALGVLTLACGVLLRS